MPFFKYRARSAEGKQITGTAEAADEAALVHQLHGQGYWVTDLRPTHPPRGVSTWRAIPPRQFAVVFRQLESSLRAGMTVFNAISNMQANSRNRRLLGILREITAGASAGQTLSSILAQHPRIFPQHVIGLVLAGEMGGCLDEMCGEVAASYEFEDSIRRKMMWPMLYLQVNIVAGILVFSFPLMLKYAAEYAMKHNTPPGSFEHVIAGVKQWAAVFATRYLPVFVVVWVLWHLGKWFIKRPNFKPMRDRLVLMLPFWGGMVRDAAMTRIMRALRAGVRAGVPMRDALLAAANAAGNEAIAQPIRSGAMQLEHAGGSISVVLGQSGQIPSTAMGMLTAAEQSGTLEDALGQLIGYFEGDRETSGNKAAGVAWLTSLGAAAVIVLIAAAVAWLTYYSAIFSISEQMMP